MSGIAPGPSGGGGGGGGTSFTDAYGAGVALVPLTPPLSIAISATSLTTQVALGLPAGVMVQMLSTRVEAAPPAPTTMLSVGTPINPAYYAPAFSSALGTTSDMWTSPPEPQSVGPFLTTGNEQILVTSNNIPAAPGGILMVHVMYWKALRATS